jgi:hypothetical protein
LAIGTFNDPAYRKQLAQFDPKRVFWWWCWGDPIRDKALELYPSVLRWHVSVRMSDYHGSMDPPAPRERALSGIATSYDPGQGFGNPWNGWGKLGVKFPRNVHPHTIPYFAHQYFFRERCWDLAITEAAFVNRLKRRLFDEDAPEDAGQIYWRLSELVLAANQKRWPAAAELAPIRRFLDKAGKRSWTPRTVDTISRMKEALGHLMKAPQKG